MADVVKFECKVQGKKGWSPLCPTDGKKKEEEREVNAVQCIM
jgi:hypothetical protein